ncbi:MAG: SsrA-binding protein SmpB [Phycisphaerae bacterium]|nr:SsrA-binding protein SmpB [Phycisphaerae bacterium]
MSKKSSDKKSDKKPRSPRVSNRRARFDYEILEKVECGLALVGTEVKSLRNANASLEGAFAHIRGSEVYLCGANIVEYKQAVGTLQHDPLRDRKLLLHRRQIRKLQTHVLQKGHTLIPLALYFKAGWAKCELGIAVGKRSYDKRRSIQDRQQKRDIDRQMKR